MVGAEKPVPIQHATHRRITITEILGGMTHAYLLPVEYCSQLVALRKNVMEHHIVVDQRLPVFDTVSIGTQPFERRRCGHRGPMRKRAPIGGNPIQFLQPSLTVRTWARMRQNSCQIADWLSVEPTHLLGE